MEVEGIDIAGRLREWSPPEPRYRSGVFAKYAAQVTSASEGAITRP
jgi:dihydroxy-acid dehydratase